MFVGRQQELKKLNAMYESGQFEFAVIYGRRRVGKTTLIKEFCKGKKAIYFVAREANDLINIENFSTDVFAVTSKESEGNVYFSNWEKAFDYVYKISCDERIILVIDEYPYLAQSNRAISSIIQAHIDMKLKDSKLFLILCGSSMSFMEYQVLGYKSPLYGRRTAQFKIKPFTYYESAKLLKGFSAEEQAVLYGITGGVPDYLARIRLNLSVKENIENLFLSESGHLFEEPLNLLKQELREPATYNGIIAAIANGALKLNEIATKNGLESNKCAKYISALMALGIIKKDKPLTENESRKSIYLLDDQMFRFWYRFIPGNMSSIATGLSDIVYEKAIVPQLPNYMGLIFEQICTQYFIRENAKLSLPFVFGRIGRWWGNNPEKKRQEEIDILAVDDENAIFGECKWKNEPTGIGVLNELVEKSGLFKQYKSKYYMIFSKSGFTKELEEVAAKMGNVGLVDLKKLYEEI
jgi:hypothetical protein